MNIRNEQLSKLLLFQGVNPLSIRSWVDECLLQDFSMGDILLSPEKYNGYIYIIIKGKASIRLNNINNNPIAYAAEGESVGEMSIFDGDIKPSAYVKAETDIHALVVSRDTLLQLIENSHGVAKNLLYLLSNRLRSGNTAVTNSQHLQKEFEQHANVDALTGLYNRRWINNYFNRLMGRIEKQNTLPDLTVLMIDVDHFKIFNDDHGHLAGDHALRCVASALKESVRPTDMVARYGGEEFLIILPETLPTDAIVAAERVRLGVKNQTIIMNDTSYPNVTISIGLSSLQKGDTFLTLIQSADEGLYQAKKNGRDQIYTMK